MAELRTTSAALSELARLASTEALVPTGRTLRLCTQTVALRVGQLTGAKRLDDLSELIANADTARRDRHT